MIIDTRCKMCGLKYHVNIHTDFLHIECCSDDCINKYIEVTGAGLRLYDVPSQYLVQKSKTTRSCKELIQKYHKKARWD